MRLEKNDWLEHKKTFSSSWIYVVSSRPIPTDLYFFMLLNSIWYRLQDICYGKGFRPIFKENQSWSNILSGGLLFYPDVSVRRNPCLLPRKPTHQHNWLLCQPTRKFKMVDWQRDTNTLFLFYKKKFIRNLYPSQKKFLQK